MADLIIQADFENDVRAQYAAYLKRQGIEVADSVIPWEVAYRYFDFRRRRIVVKPRLVVRSKELDERVLPDDLAAGVQAIVDDATGGQDLSPFLRKLWKNLEDHDPLFNDWGVHHMHLGGRQLDDDGFVKRGGPLLYVFVTESELHLLDVLDHGAFAARRLVQILEDNWPHLIADAACPESFECDPVSDETRRLMSRRKNKTHFTLMVSTNNGTMYAPMGGGSMSSGHSTNAVDRANALFNHINDLQKQYIAAGAQIRDRLAEKLGTQLGELHLALQLAEAGHLQVWETQTNTPLRFTSTGP